MRSRSPKLFKAAGRRGRSHKRNFHLAVHATTGSRHESYLRQYLSKAHQLLRPPLRWLSLALVGDATMTRLHDRYLGIAAPTDVLTFELEHDRRGRVTGGEVIICVPEARRRAKKLGSTVERELLLYALHGMLHLAGLDDRTPAGFRQMHRREDQILTRLGVGAVFAPEQPARRAPARTGGR